MKHKKRGRKSGAELSTLAAVLVEKVVRPPAPVDLHDDDMAAEWDSIVGSLPADWFPRSSWPLLTQYCRQIVRARRVAHLLHVTEHEGDGFDVEQWEKLIKLETTLTKSIASLATKMRLALVSLKRQDRTPVPELRGRMPWESE